MEEARDMVMQPATSSELLDSSSESETTSEEECDVEFVVESDPSSSDPSTVTAEETEDSGSGWTSTNCEIWSPSNNDTLRYIPAARGLVPGPTRYAITRIDDVESSFNLFFTAEIISSIVDMTNLQGGCSVANWSDVDATDIRAYIGLLMLAGVYKSKGESTRSLWDDHSGRAIFRATMTHTKFRLMNTTLRFDDKLMRPSCHREDKLAPIRSLWEKWTHRLPMLFNPGEDVCVDEQLVPFRGRCKFRQYIPSKPAKYGLKIWITADVETSYAWKCQIYTGKAAGSAAEVGQGKRVVLEMTEGLQGITVTCDNLFTSYALVLFTAVDPSWKQAKSFRRRLFLEELGRSLVSAKIMRRKHPPRTPAAVTIVADIQASAAAPDTGTTASGSTKKRGLCWMCTGKKKKSATTCIRCEKFTCREHQIPCCRFCWMN